MSAHLRPRLGARALLLAAGAALAAAPAAFAGAAAQDEQPLYRDTSQPVETRVEDLLGRMTLEEKVAQMLGIWLTKGDIEDGEGNFSPENASANYPHGIGQISRPSDFRGVDESESEAAGATEGAGVEALVP
jgi:beta-glucosidase